MDECNPILQYWIRRDENNRMKNGIYFYCPQHGEKYLGTRVIVENAVQAQMELCGEASLTVRFI